jgi:hypothetical protein
MKGQCGEVWGNLLGQDPVRAKSEAEDPPVRRYACKAGGTPWPSADQKCHGNELASGRLVHRTIITFPRWAIAGSNLLTAPHSNVPADAIVILSK